MGTSTVSGPFRSQNGFQELVDGVWTPVGGGGSTALIVAPGTTDLVFTEVGQIITVVAFNPDSTPGNYVFNLNAPSGLPISFYSIVYTNSLFPFSNTELNANGSPTFGAGPLQLTFVYQGDAVSGFYGPTSYFSASGFATQAA